jgi:heme-degrading monooxygenase HmoA
MYGPIAKLKLKPGMLDRVREMANDEDRPEGSVALSVFQMDADPNEIWMVAISESREAYRAFSESPESHEQYLKMRDWLETDPEWHDGEIIRYEHSGNGA